MMVVVVVDIEDPLHHLQIYYIYISNQFHVFFSRVGPWRVGDKLRDLNYLNEFFGCSHL